MINYDYTVTVTGNTAKLDKDIYLFRGNKNVHYYFAVKNASFNFKGSTDLIEKTNAINAAVTVIKPNGVEVANAIAEVENGKIHLKVTEDLIDEESIVVTMTQLGYIKRIPLDTYKNQNRGGKGIIGVNTIEED